MLNSLGAKSIYLFGTLIALGVIVGVLAWNHHIGYADFPQYASAGRMFLENRAAEVYTPATIKAEQHLLFPTMKRDFVLFCYPPFAQVLFAPIALFPSEVGFWIWMIMSVICYIASVFVLCRAWNIEPRYRWAILFFSSLLGPVIHVILMTQPAFFMLLGLSLFILFVKQKRQYLAGVCLLPLVAKPHYLAPLLFYLAGSKRYKELIGVCSAGAALVAITLLHPGFDCYVAYVQALKMIDRSISIPLPGVTHGNIWGCVTIRSQLLRLIPNHDSEILIGSTVLWLLVLCFLFWLGRRYSKDRRWFEIGILASLPLGCLNTQYIQPYDLTLWLPSALVLIFVPLGHRFPINMKWVLTFFFLTLIFPSYKELHFTDLPWYPMFWLCVCFVALAMVNVWKNPPVDETGDTGELTSDAIVSPITSA